MNEGNSYWFLIYFLPAEFSPWIMLEFLYCIGWGLGTAKSSLVEQIASLNWITEGAKKLWCHALCLLHVWLNKYWFQIFHTLLPGRRRICAAAAASDFLLFFFFSSPQVGNGVLRLLCELVRAEQVNVQTHSGVCRVCVTTEARLAVQSEEMDKLCCLIEPGWGSIQSGI